MPELWWLLHLRGESIPSKSSKLQKNPNRWKKSKKQLRKALKSIVITNSMRSLPAVKQVRQIVTKMKSSQNICTWNWSRLRHSKTLISTPWWRLLASMILWIISWKELKHPKNSINLRVSLKRSWVNLSPVMNLSRNLTLSYSSNSLKQKKRMG